MNKHLKILYVEDNNYDVELVIRELARAGFKTSFRVAVNETEFLAGLESLPDLILSDFALPQFDGLTALHLLNKSSLEIPFILISGTLGEEAAVTSIKQGAADYLMKDRLSRLGTAVERAIEEQRQRIERRNAETALKQSEACLRIVSHFARIGFVVINPEHRLVFSNTAFAELFGLRPDDVAGRLLPDLLPVGYEEQVRQWLKKAFAGERLEYELRLPTPKAQSCLLVNFEPVIEHGCVSSVVVVIMDITARRITEDQLKQSQKMEAVGQLAGGISHEFNNLLTVISTYTSLLLNSDSLGQEELYFVNEIGKATERSADLTRRLLSFGRGQIQAPEAIHLNEVIVETKKLLALTLGRQVEIVLGLEPDLKTIWMDRNELSQILINLSINARDAMPDGGRLEIQTQNIILEKADAEGRLSVRPGNYVLLSVSDNGCGMSADTQLRIFEPFFSTKPTAKGTGLGLSIVHSIVSRSGGAVEVSSSIGKGTTFRIYIPLPLDARNAIAPARSFRTLNGTETILLVDDDDMVRLATRSILTEYGYTVIEAENAKKAILALLDRPKSIHLLLTDHRMPEMSGVELIEYIEQFCPGTPALLISGYIAEIDVRNHLSDRNLKFLQKPFQPESLATKVRDILDRHAEQRGS